MTMMRKCLDLVLIVQLLNKCTKLILIMAWVHSQEYLRISPRTFQDQEPMIRSQDPRQQHHHMGSELLNELQQSQQVHQALDSTKYQSK